MFAESPDGSPQIGRRIRAISLLHESGCRCVGTRGRNSQHPSPGRLRHPVMDVSTTASSLPAPGEEMVVLQKGHRAESPRSLVVGPDGVYVEREGDPEGRQGASDLQQPSDQHQADERDGSAHRSASSVRMRPLPEPRTSMLEHLRPYEDLTHPRKSRRSGIWLVGFTRVAAAGPPRPAPHLILRRVVG